MWLPKARFGPRHRRAFCNLQPQSKRTKLWFNPGSDPPTKQIIGAGKNINAVTTLIGTTGNAFTRKDDATWIGDIVAGEKASCSSKSKVRRLRLLVGLQMTGLSR